MRILLCGVAAFALSGCSWMHSHNNIGSYSQNSGVYNSTPSYSSQKPRQPSKFSIFGSLGTDIGVGGQAITGNDTLFNPTTNVSQVSMKDAFGRTLRGELGGAYKLGKSNEVSLSGFYQKASGKDTVIGQHTSGNAVLGKLSNYKGYGLEAGLRHNFANAKLPLLNSIQPYVEGRVGAAHLDDITLNDVRVAGGGAALPMQAFYKGGWVPTASGLVGFEKPVSRKASIGLETGLRYTGGLGADNTTITGSFLQGANNGSSRWSVPVQIRGRYRF